MQRAKQVIALFERFADNYKQFTELNDALLVDCSAREWQELLTRRSEIQRRLLAENEEILRQARDLMSAPISSKEEADEILVYYRKLLNTRLCDYCLLEIVYPPLNDFYEKTEDYLRLIGLNVSVGAQVLEFFGGMDISMSPINGRECCEKAIAYSKMVSPLEQPDVWISVISAYANMIGSAKSYYPELRKDFFKYYDEALGYFEDPVIGPVLNALPNGPSFRDLIRGRILYGSESYKVMSEEDRERFRLLMLKEIQSPPEGYNKGEIANLQNHTAYFIGDKKPRDAFEDLLYAYINLKKPDYNIKNILIKTEDYLTRVIILSGLLDILSDAEFTAEERRDNLARIKPLVLELTHSVPYGYMTSYVNLTSGTLCEQMIPLLDSPDEIKNVISSLLILRQPITYIHSLMVREISKLIAREMLRTKPMLFVPAFGQSEQEVLGRSAEIIHFVEDAALFHDIGKTKVADVINNQYRRITDLEFQYIKLHPSRGPEIVSDQKYFLPYCDIMLGHHKSYDGKGGYPADFDNTDSPYRIIIDLITIADCTDAATDILGRNYARGKSFYDLLGELSAGKGTRYNPDIVTLIEESKELCEQLCFLTGEDRSRIYYRAYRDVMNLNTAE